MAEYTKGEWKREEIHIKVFGRGTIATTPTIDNGGVLERVANARLIASAPALYEALKEADAIIVGLCKRLNPNCPTKCKSCPDRMSSAILQSLASVEGQ